jgi:hypothetical protein
LLLFIVQPVGYFQILQIQKNARELLSQGIVNFPSHSIALFDNFRAGQSFYNSG